MDGPPPGYTPPPEYNYSPPPAYTPMDEGLVNLITNAHIDTVAQNAEENAEFVQDHLNSFQLLADRGWQPLNAWNYLNRIEGRGRNTPAEVYSIAENANENAEHEVEMTRSPGDIDAPISDFDRANQQNPWANVVFILRRRGFDQEYTQALAYILDGVVQPEELQDAFELDSEYLGQQGQLGWLYSWVPDLQPIFGVPPELEDAFREDSDVDMGDDGTDGMLEDGDYAMYEEGSDQSSLPDYEPSPPTPAGTQSTRFDMATGYATGQLSPPTGSDSGSDGSADDHELIDGDDDSEDSEEAAQRYLEETIQAIQDEDSESQAFHTPPLQKLPEGPVAAGRPDGTPPSGSGGGQEFEDDDGLFIRLRGGPASSSPSSRRSSLKSSPVESPSGPPGDSSDGSDSSDDDDPSDDDGSYNGEPIDDDEASDDHSTGEDSSDNDHSDENDEDDEARNAIHDGLTAMYSDANNDIVETYKSVLSVMADIGWTPYMAWRFVKWMHETLPLATMAERINMVSEISEDQLTERYTYTEEESLLADFAYDPNLAEIMRQLYQAGFASDYLRGYRYNLQLVGRPIADIYDDLEGYDPREWIWEWAPAMWEIWNDADLGDYPPSTSSPGTQPYSPSYPPERPASFDHWTSPGLGSPTASELAHSYDRLYPRTPPSRRSSSARNSPVFAPHSPHGRALPGSPTSSTLARERRISTSPNVPPSGYAQFLPNSPDYAPVSSPIAGIRNSPAGSRPSSSGTSSSGLSSARSMSDPAGRGPPSAARSSSGSSSARSHASQPGSGSGSGSRRSSGERSSSRQSSERPHSDPPSSRRSSSARSMSNPSIPRGSPREPSFSPASRPRGIIKRTPPRRRTPLVDPLRYTNRLTPPRRLPDTPSQSPRPPSPRRSGSRPRVCGECGRPYPRSSPGGVVKTPSPAVRKASPVIKDPSRPDGSSSPSSLLASPVKKAPIRKASVKKAPVKKAPTPQAPAPTRRSKRTAKAPDRFGG